MKKIQFYRVTDDYGILSNFAPFPIKIDDIVWPTTEHYFQAQKFLDKQDQEEIRQARTPFEAAEMGRDRSRQLRSDWEEIKINVMRKALYAKFTQYITLKNELLSTADALLVEHTKNDAFWGDGGNGTGENMLGILLMELRDKLSGNQTIINPEDIV